jgi:hypothetical protein
MLVGLHHHFCCKPVCYRLSNLCNKKGKINQGKCPNSFMAVAKITDLGKGFAYGIWSTFCTRLEIKGIEPIIYNMLTFSEWRSELFSSISSETLTAFPPNNQLARKQEKRLPACRTISVGLKNKHVFERSANTTHPQKPSCLKQEGMSVCEFFSYLMCKKTHSLELLLLAT